MEENVVGASSISDDFFEHTESSLNDEEIGKRAKAGCKRSLNRLLTLYRPRIYWFIRRAGISGHHDIEELTQETLIQIQRSIWRFEGRSKISSWIFSIAKNIVKNHLSRSPQYRYSFVDIEDEEFTDDSRKGPLAAALHDAENSKLLAQIDTLSEKLKQPLVLTALKEFILQVAEQRDMTRGARSSSRELMVQASLHAVEEMKKAALVAFAGQ